MDVKRVLDIWTVSILVDSSVLLVDNRILP